MVKDNIIPLSIQLYTDCHWWYKMSHLTILTNILSLFMKAKQTNTSTDYAYTSFVIYWPTCVYEYNEVNSNE